MADGGDLGQYRACANQITKDNIPYPQSESLWEFAFQCKLNQPQNGDHLPLCPNNILLRIVPCTCTGIENFKDIPAPVSLYDFLST